MQGNTLNIVFYVIVLMFSVIIHEVCHGLAARKLGDKTAEYEGRLTLNPIPHIDLIGTIILPLFLVISGSPFMVGWAKPVPFNPDNFYDTPFIRRWGEALVAIAGPASNIALALIFGLFLRFFEQMLFTMPFLSAVIPTIPLIQTIVIVNIVLATFNMMPVPPLDGSKILFAFFPRSLFEVRRFMERHMLLLSFIFIFFVWQYLAPIILIIYRLIVGA